jgi:putative membrane protein
LVPSATVAIPGWGRSFQIHYYFAAGLVLSMHFFGFWLMCWPPTRDFFVSLTPLNLLVSAFFLGIFRDSALAGPPAGPRFWLAAAVVCAGGFLAEVAGVQTGAIFGQYAYGGVLGPKAWGTPWVIGVNWFILIGATTSVCAGLRVPVLVRVGLAATLMMGLDVLIEPVAIDLGFWHWFGQPVPLQNYVAWWVLGAALIGLYHWLGAVGRNPMAPVVLVAQLFFFTGHNFFIYLR